MPVGIAIRKPIRAAVGIPIGLVVATTIHRPVHGAVQVAIAAGLLHLALGGVPDVRVVRLEARAGVAGAHGREEVDVEREHVEGEDEGDGPLEDRGGVGGLLEVAGREGDGEDHFDYDEGELDVEGDAENAVGVVVW